MFKKFRERTADSINEEAKRALGLSEGYPHQMCANLQQMGINARVINPKGPEAIARTPVGGFFLPMFCVVIDGRNIQAIDVITHSTDEAEILMYYRYLMRVQLGERDNELGLEPIGSFSPMIAESRPVESGDPSRQLDINWKGKRLADILNADTELKNIMIAKNMLHFTIWKNSKDQFIWVTPFPRAKSDQWFDLKAFEIADRIAQHIRTLVPR